MAGKKKVRVFKAPPTEDRVFDREESLVRRVQLCDLLEATLDREELLQDEIAELKERLVATTTVVRELNAWARGRIIPSELSELSTILMHASHVITDQE